MAVKFSKRDEAFERMRRWPRASVRIPAAFDERSLGIVLDLSEGGLRFQTERDLVPGSQIDVRLMLVPGSEPLTLPGTVVWRFDRIHGIELTNLPGRAATCLRRTVAYHLGTL